MATRKDTTLELVITDMATLLNPPATKDPLKQDQNKKGKPSEHGVVIVAPRTNANFQLPRHKKKIHIRPQPDSKVADFMIDIGTHKWEEVFENLDPHAKAEKYHETLITKLNKHLKEKTVNMTSLDKTWFSPILKLKYNEMQNEYFKHGKSEK